MKKLFSLFLTATIIYNLSAQTKVFHLNMGSHSETSDQLNYLNLPDHNTMRALVKQMADSIIAKNVKWNMQVDANFIRGTLKNDTAYTNPNDILEWADDQANIEVDPHNHFDASTNPYNFADLAHLLDSCGLTGTRKNVGGFLWSSSNWTTANDHWDTYGSGLKGNTYPTYTWTPTVLWGAGSTPPHSNDIDDLGIWKPSGPGSKIQFKTHDSSKKLTVIGHGCNWVIFDTTSNPMWIVNDIVAHLNYFASQPVTSNTFYVGTIMMNFRDFNSANYINKVMTVINGLAAYGPSGTGQIAWQTLTEKYNAWSTAHLNPADNFELECSNVVLGVEDVNSFSGEISVFPNPTSSFITFTVSEGKQYHLFNVYGQELSSHTLEMGTNKIDVSNLRDGIYFLKIGNTAKKIVISK